MNIRKSFARAIHSTSMPSVILFALALLFIAFGTSANFDWNYLVSFINSNIAVLCICVGEAVIILTGGIDISLGSTVSLCNVLLIILMKQLQIPLFPAILIMFLVAIACGALNGFMVGVMRISPLLTSYATSIIYAGLALVITRVPVYLKLTELSAFYKYRIFDFIPMSLIFLLIPYLMWKLYKHTPWGMHIYAIGQNEQSAYSSGISVIRTKMVAYSFGGFCAGMGALAMTSMIQGGDPKIGATMSMTAISAVAIGGVALSGGKGDAGGSIFGSLFLVTVSNIIVFWGIDTFWQEMLRNLILLVSIVAAVLLSNSNLKSKMKIKRGEHHDGKSQ